MTDEEKAAVRQLVAKAKALVEKMALVETQHGGLTGPDTLMTANVLRLELSRWKGF